MLKLKSFLMSEKARSKWDYRSHSKFVSLWKVERTLEAISLPTGREYRSGWENEDEKENRSSDEIKWAVMIPSSWPVQIWLKDIRLSGSSSMTHSRVPLPYTVQIPTLPFTCSHQSAHLHYISFYFHNILYMLTGWCGDSEGRRRVFGMGK